MRASARSLFPVVFLCASATLAQDKSENAAPTNSVAGATYITHVTVIDTITGKELRDETVLISGDRISAVEDSIRLRPEAGAKIVDGRGKYLIPGLWDMHVHAFRKIKAAGFDFVKVYNGVPREAYRGIAEESRAQSISFVSS